MIDVCYHLYFAKCVTKQTPLQIPSFAKDAINGFKCHHSTARGNDFEAWFHSLLSHRANLPTISFCPSVTHVFLSFYQPSLFLNFVNHLFFSCCEPRLLLYSIYWIFSKFRSYMKGKKTAVVFDLTFEKKIGWKIVNPKTGKQKPMY